MALDRSWTPIWKRKDSRGYLYVENQVQEYQNKPESEPVG